MKNILLLLPLLGLLIIHPSIQGQVNIQWESRFDNAGFADFARGIVIDAAGNSYVTGTTYNGSSFDIVTVKYDVDGNQLWLHTYNGPANGWDDATGIVLDSNNDVIVGGFHQISASDFDIMAIKINGNTGAQVWLYSNAGTANFDLCNAVGIDSENNVILAGSRESAAINQDYVTISVSPAGTLNWAQTFSSAGSNRDVINALAIDNDRNVYVTGESWGGADNLDYYTIKYSPTGAVIWAARFDGANSIDSPKAIAVDGNGNTYVVGTSYRNVTVEEDIMLTRINNAGVTVWNQVYGGTAQDFDSPSDLTTDALGNVYVAGKVKNLGNGEDFYIARYRPNGNLHWNYIYQSPTNGYDEAKRVYINSNFEVYASGYSNLTGNNDDYVTMRLDTLGSEVWFTRFNGPASASDQMSDFRVDATGNIFVTGSSVGSGTNRDYSTIKYCQLNTVATAAQTQICIGQSTQLNSTGGFNFQWSVISGDPITALNFSCTSCTNPVASPTSTTTYAVSSESSSGCVDTDTITIIVNPLPGPAITPNGPTEFCIGGTVQLTADAAAQYNWSNGLTTQTISTDTSGTFALTVTDAMGCQNSTSVQVTVYPKPIVNGGPDRFRCPGISLTFNATGNADSLVWFRLPTPSSPIANGVAFVPPSTGNYMVIGYSTDGCENRDTVLVTVYPTPLQIAITQGMSGNLFVNTTDGTTSWFKDGAPLGITGPIFFYDSLPYCNGLYSVLYTDENGCTSTDQIDITDACPEDSTNNVASFNLGDHYTVYPNPTADHFTIEFQDLKDRRIVLYSMQGKAILHERKTDTRYEIDISSFAKGTYMILIESSEGTSRTRVIKQ